MIEVRIEIEEGKTGLFYATSPDMKGLLVVEPIREALLVSVPCAICDLQRAEGRHARAHVVFPPGFP